MSKKPFDKFINKKESGAKKKEKIRQEKKQLRAEKNAYFDELKRQAREQRKTGSGIKSNASPGSRPIRNDAKPATGKKTGSYSEFKSKGRSIDRKPPASGIQPKPFVKNDGRILNHSKHPTGFSDRKDSSSENRDQHPDFKSRNRAVDKKIVTQPTSFTKKDASSSKTSKLSTRTTDSNENQAKREQSTSKPVTKNNSFRPSINKAEPKSEIKSQKSKNASDDMPLNKFIAWSGVCGRREAADLVKAGKVTVNGNLVIEPPFRVSQQDDIKVNGKKISVQKNLVYILLNKPKDYITTTDDPEGRKTVMDLIKKATPERVFPVGRLDRNTTGVLLLTNDGEVAQRLTHPKYEVKKIYEVKLDKPVTKQQLDTIASGITLEDGFVQPDSIAYADTKDKSVIGIEIHSGRNRIVRRIFEHLGFDVKNLDRVMYGIFTKKNVDRGKWRFLSEKEIRLLKHLNTSFSNKKNPG